MSQGGTERDALYLPMSRRAESSQNWIVIDNIKSRFKSDIIWSDSVRVPPGRAREPGTSTAKHYSAGSLHTVNPRLEAHIENLFLYTAISTPV